MKHPKSVNLNPILPVNVTAGSGVGPYQWCGINLLLCLRLVLVQYCPFTVGFSFDPFRFSHFLERFCSAVVQKGTFSCMFY